MQEQKDIQQAKEKLFSAEEIVRAFYEAGLDRTPDSEGAEGWCEALRGGHDLSSVLKSFLDTPEFREKCRVRPWNPDPLTSKFYFVHIPKTGGSSVTEFLKGNLPENALFPFSFPRDLFRSTDSLERYLYFSGHFQGLLDMALSQSTRKAVLLREPVARTISHFLHYKRDDTSRHHALFKEMSVEDMVNTPQARRIFGNYQAKYLHSVARDSGPWILPLWEEEEDFFPRNKKELLQAARNVLQEIEVIGVSDRHEQFCRNLAMAWGLQARHFEVRANSAPNPLQEVISPEALRRIAEWNEVDTEIYEQARRECGPAATQ